MTFKTLTGTTRRPKNIKKSMINWGRPSRSKFQTRVKSFLEKYWSNHVVLEEFTIPGSRLSLDFYNANKKIAVEVQGGQHLKYVPFFHNNNRANFKHQQYKDAEKFRFCEINGITLIEIYPKDKINKSLFKKFGVDL